MGNKGVICETQLQAVTALISMNAEDSLRIQREENCPLELRIFDCMWWNGEYIGNRPLIERIPYVNKAVKELQDAGIQCRRPYSSYSNKLRFYKTMIALGNEGGVLKNLYSPYVATSQRKKDGFVKVKRTMSETMQDKGISDGIDAYITGYELGSKGTAWEDYIGSLEFSVIMRNKDGSEVEHKIARISNIPLELRKKITVMGSDGKPELDKSYYGKVATIDGQCMSARALRLRHARLIEWRPDRSADTCYMDEDFIKSMVL